MHRTSRHSGNQETQDKGGKRKSWLMKKVDEWAKDKVDKLGLKITHFEIHGFTLSQGLIIKLEVEFSYPLPCDITKCCKSVTYNVKNQDEVLFSGDVKPSKTPRKKGKGKVPSQKTSGKPSEFPSGDVKPSKTPRKKGKGKVKTVEVEINISFHHLEQKFEEIKQSIALNSLKCELELKISVIGIFLEPIPAATYHVMPETVSGALRKYGMPKLKEKTTEGYNMAEMALDIYEGKDSIKNVAELLRVLLEKSHPDVYKACHFGLQVYDRKDVSLKEVDKLLKDLLEESHHQKVYNVCHFGLEVLYNNKKGVSLKDVDGLLHAILDSDMYDQVHPILSKLEDFEKVYGTVKKKGVEIVHEIADRSAEILHSGAEFFHTGVDKKQRRP